MKNVLNRTENRCFRTINMLRSKDAAAIAPGLPVYTERKSQRRLVHLLAGPALTPTAPLLNFIMFCQVDGQRNQTRSSPGPLRGLRDFKHLFVGGYREYTPELLPLGSRFSQGFQGERSNNPNPNPIQYTVYYTCIYCIYKQYPTVQGQSLRPRVSGGCVMAGKLRIFHATTVEL